MISPTANVGFLGASYCQLAAGRLSLWQKANPDLSVSDLSQHDAFRVITGLDREVRLSRDCFLTLQEFFKGLHVSDPLQGAMMKMVLPTGFGQMLEGAIQLFDSNYPKVRQRHEIFSHLVQEEGAAVVADYLLSNRLLPQDDLRGELLQFNLQSSQGPGAVEPLRKVLIDQISESIERDFPMVKVRNRDPSAFRNGAPSRVLITLTPEMSGQELEAFFASESARFVEGVRLRLPRETTQSLRCLKRFLELPLIRSLKELDLSFTQIGDAGVQALANSPSLSQLKALNLRRTQIGDAGNPAFANAPFFSQLQRKALDLNFTQTGNAEVRLNANYPYIQTGGTGTQALVNSPYLSQLTTLDLSGTRIGERMKALIKARWPFASV